MSRDDSERIEIRTTPAEKAVIVAAAERAGLSVASWLRMAALAAARKGGK